MEYTGEKLQALADDLRERMTGLQGFNAIEEIHAYCDTLEADATVAFESAFRHLQRLQESTLDEISQYRNGLIEAEQQKRAATMDQDHQTTFTKELAELTNFKVMNEQDRAAAGVAIETRLRDARKQLTELRKMTMGGRFMLFKPNRFFDLVLDHVGSIEYLDEFSQASCERLEIQDDSYCCAKKCQSIMQISFMPGDRLVACTLKDGVFIFRASDLRLLEHLPGPAFSMLVLPAERLVIGRVDGELRIYDLRKPLSCGRETRDFIFLDDNKDKRRRTICSIALLPPNGRLATADVSGRIEIWNLDLAGTEKALCLAMKENLACKLGALSNGFLVSCTMRTGVAETLKLWDLKSAKPIRVGVTSSIFVLSLLVLPNDQVALGDSLGYIAIFDPIEMNQVWKIHLESDGGVVSLGYLPSNGCLMSCDNKKRCHLWDHTSGKLVQILETGFRKQFTSIAISPDGKRMAIAPMNYHFKTYKLNLIQDI